MLALYIYIAGIVIINIFGLIRNIETPYRGLFIVMYFWPLFLPLIAVILIGWDFNIIRSIKRFAFRRPNDNWPGFAITVFNYELQFWKLR